LEYPLAGTLHRRRLNASRNAGLLATVHAPRVNYERELIARPGPVGDETPTQRDQLSWAILPQPGDRIWVVGATLEARRDFLEEGCELKELRRESRLWSGHIGHTSSADSCSILCGASPPSFGDFDTSANIAGNWWTLYDSAFPASRICTQVARRK
jgi:hypothetical protein